MAKYKVGDKVKVVYVDSNYNSHSANLLGKTVTIRTVDDDNTYQIEEDGGYTWWCGWRFEPVLCTNTISLEIDPSKPDEAHKVVSDAIERYKQKQREWTEEEIEQAKHISRELILKLFDDGEVSPVFYLFDDLLALNTSFGTPSKEYSYVYRKNYRTDFNEHIGKCVCLCKAANTPVPDFIRNKNK